ncbi:alkaline phytoceramidase, partial [Acephala macrosclerotiorum]
QDFYLTSYVAEFINTATSLMYLYLGWVGIQNTKCHSRDKIIIFCYFLLACVGPGSMAYHITIKYTGQMIDEFSMLYATSAILFAAFSVTLQPSSRFSLGISVSCMAFATSIIHYCLDYTPGFQIVFGMMVFTVFCECVWLVKTRVDDQEVAGDMKGLALFGAGIFVWGYVLWNVDNEFCAELRSLRDAVGMPLGFVLELHGWWHIFTGLAVYYYMVFIEYLRLYLGRRGRDAESFNFILIWRSAFDLPHIEAIQYNPERSNGRRKGM